MDKSKVLEIDDMTYWTDGSDLGDCEGRGCHERGFSYNENGQLFCEECLIEWHENELFNETGLDLTDPNLCEQCGGDLDVYEVCNSCDV